MKITEKLLTPNKYSRPQIPLNSVKKVVLHYTGDAGASAIAERNYFENCATVFKRYVSSNYIVGIEGEIIRCVPENEVAYCSNQANTYSISIECCYPKSEAKTGKFTKATTESAAELCAYLLKKYGLSVDDLIRHYDVTGKQCPLYFVPTKYQSVDVANARWAEFKDLVSKYMHAESNTAFKVKVIDTSLNVRSAAGVNNKIVTVLRGGVYTITETKKIGSAKWGKLKSGIGWINIGKQYVKRV